MGDSFSDPPEAKRPKLAENSSAEELETTKIFASLEAVNEKLLQHQEAVEQKINMIKCKAREMSRPLYDERRRYTQKIPNFWYKAVRPFHAS